MHPTVRPLARSEWRRFRTLRLRALRAEPGAFGGRYADEAALGDEEWKARVRAPGRQAFGAFDDGTLVGIAAAWICPDDPAGETAVFGMSYVEPAYRSRGLADLLYDARLRWARASDGLAVVRLGIRASNAASECAARRNGFALVGRAPRRWADGIVEDEAIYECPLAADGAVEAAAS